MADTCDTTAVEELSETRKSEFVLSNNVIESIPDDTTSEQEKTQHEMDVSAIRPQQNDAVSDSLDMDKPAAIDAEPPFEGKATPGTFQSNAPETSSPIPETPNITEPSQTALTVNTEALMTENYSEAKTRSEEIGSTDRHTNPTLDTLATENINPPVTENSEKLATEGARCTNATLDTLATENINSPVTENSEALATEGADTCTDATLETLETDNINPPVTENSEALATKSADTCTDATLETLATDNINPPGTENPEALATKGADTCTDATLETLATDNINPPVTENSEALATEGADKCTDATLETLATENLNPSVTDNSETLVTQTADPSMTEHESIHIQAETIDEEALENLDNTQNYKLTETSDHKESDLPESTETQITQSKDTDETSIDETPSTELTDAIKIKMEAEEISTQSTETISQELQADKQFTGPELETEAIVSSATPFIKSEIHEAESEDVEMAEPQSETSAAAESQNTETPIDTRKDQTDTDQDESMAQIQIDDTSKGLPVNGDALDESANDKDVEMEEGDGEPTVTMLDVLQEQAELEDNADAVLGASDDKNCTYSEGYIKRQALYACLTCCSDAKIDPTKRAGVCLACSLSCHENHDLIELYTKRNFRCDCGNPNFNSQTCTFTKDKSEFNVDNKYNQNFSGLYCICHRPYPDPESTVDDEMIQCVVCEDWLHASHLGASVPANDQYSEMICKLCMDENDFLHDYTSYMVNIEENEEVDVVNGPEKMNGFKDISLETSKKTHDKNLPLSEIAVGVNSEEKLRDETIDSSTKESTDDLPVNVTTNEGSTNKTNDSDLNNRSVQMENITKEASTEEVPIITPIAEEAGEAENNLTTIFESTESTINDDSTKVVHDDESFKTLNEKTVEKIATKDSTEENTSKNVIEETAGETTTQDGTEEKMQGSSSENVIEKTVEKLPSQDDIEEKMQDSSSKNLIEHPVEKLPSHDEIEEKIEEKDKNVIEETEGQLLTKGDTEEKMDDSSNTNTDTEKIEETPGAIGDMTTEIEMNKKVEEEDKSADNDKPAIVSENTISTTVENELKAQDESKELSSDIAHPSDICESVNKNKSLDEMFEADTSTTDTSLVAENIKTPANGEGLNAFLPNENNTDVESEENIDKHSILENSEQMSNNLNQDVEMAENDTATTESDTIPNASETDNSEQELKPTQLEKTDNISTDVEMKDHTVSIISNIDKNIPQPQETEQSDVLLPEANKEPNILAENNETQVADQQDCIENTNKRKLSSDISEDNEQVKRTKLDNGTNIDDGCKRPKFTGKRFKGATFWPCSWRKKLCSCHNCVSMYRDKQVLFLLDLEDTVSAYEELGKEKSDGKLSQYEKGLRALSSLDRIQQINALTEYNKMKDELLNFLISFKNRQEVVKVEDIEKFFADIKPKKKSDGVYFCR